MATSRVDVHCHLFNRDFAFGEALNIVLALANKTYPLHARLRSSGDEVDAVMQGGPFRGIVRYIRDLYAPFIHTCAENYSHELSAFKEGELPTDALIVAPLMMDIFFMFADEATPEALTPAEAPARGSLVSDFKQHAKHLKEQLLEAVRAHPSVSRLPSDEARKGVLARVDADTERLIERHLERVIEPEERAATIEGINPAGMEMSWGYEEHLQDLVELWQAHPGKVFPFVAVDPRRPGIIDFVKKNVQRTGPLYGVKIYPPLGYFPNDERLGEVYDHCLAADVPITVHTQPRAFVNPWGHTDDPGCRFANPRHWEAILAARPNLRVNFAHFGGICFARAYAKDPDFDACSWTRTIVELMKYPNVYADVAAFAEPDAAAVVNEIVRRDSHVAERLMFGTDYVICLLHENVDGKLSRYLNLFPTVSADHAEALFYANARRFLNAQTEPQQ